MFLPSKHYLREYLVIRIVYTHYTPSSFIRCRVFISVVSQSLYKKTGMVTFRTDSEDWKDFISKPALPYVLRVLAGLSKGHEKTAVTIGREMVPMLHKLEQVSSDEHIGTLAENLLDAVREHPTVAAKVTFIPVIKSLLASIYDHIYNTVKCGKQMTSLLFCWH